MTKDDDVDTRIAALQKEILRLRELLQQQGIDAADAAMKATQREYRQERELRAERDATSAADLRAEAESERADRAEINRTKLEAQYEELVRNSNFNRQVLQSTTDCVSARFGWQTGFHECWRNAHDGDRRFFDRRSLSLEQVLARRGASQSG